MRGIPSAAGMGSVALLCSILSACAGAPSVPPSAAAPAAVEAPKTPKPGPSAPAPATPPLRPMAPKAVPAKPAPPAASSPSSKEGRAGQQSPYLRDILASYTHLALPNGSEVYLLKRQGREVALRIALSEYATAQSATEAGLEALALDLATKGSDDMEAGAVARALCAASARLDLALDGSYGPAIELSCPRDSLYPLLDVLGQSLASPAFRRDDFETCLMNLRVEERREHSDRALRASAELGAALYGRASLARWPVGSADTLAKIRLEDVERYWKTEFGGDRIRMSLVGDVDPDELAKRLSPAAGRGIGSLPRQAAPAQPSTPPPSTVTGALLIRAVPGSTGWTVLRGEFGLPPTATPDYAALSLGLTMLDELLGRELRAAVGGDETRRVSISGEVYGVGSIEIAGGGDPAAAMDAVQWSLRSLAAGRCVGLRSPGGDLESFAEGIADYRARSVVEYYSGRGSSAELATLILREALRGADPMAFFRVADQIAAAKPEDVLRVVKERIAGASLSWVALGDPALLSGLEARARQAAVQ